MGHSDIFDHFGAIAVIGMAGRFPGAKNIGEFWMNLRDSVESIAFFSEQELMTFGIDPTELNAPQYVKASAVLEDIEWFDASFFDITPRDAELTDPQHRIFLECAWESLENAGYAPDRYRGRIGIYAGSGMNTYLLFNLFANRNLFKSTGLFNIAIGNEKDSLTTRVSYKLGLKGPSVSVNSMCSTSLVAVHLACQSLLNGECDMALAGGVRIVVPQKVGYLYQEGGIGSPDGHCRAFDSDAKGTVDGSGVGIVVLKRLTDAITDGDTISAVIRGSAINNDGSLKVGYTAPSMHAQAEVITEALEVAGVEPETITYVEAHGTGTPLGDPIEIAALTQAFQRKTTKKCFCALGSVKTNIGHLDAAAGVTGLIKTVLALKHQLLPPSLHYKQANPQIDFANSPFYVNKELSEWKTVDTPRRAGVSSFGIGGTNAHVILEETPPPELSGPSRPYHLVTISAKTATALSASRTNLVKHIRQHPDINPADLAYTLKVGRKAFRHRLIAVCQNLEDIAVALETQKPGNVFSVQQEPRNCPVVFMFPGQGTQYVNMALELYQIEPTFKRWIDHCAEFLKSHVEIDIRDVLYPNPTHIEVAQQLLKQTYITQPIVFTLEYSLAKLLTEWGIHLHAMIGHSLGEYVAACLAGVFSLEDALSLVAKRGKMIQALPEGAMLAVSLQGQELSPFLNKNLSLAASNSPSRSVVSGPKDIVSELAIQLRQNNLASQPLLTSHAFHSSMMDPIMMPFIEEVRKVQLSPPELPYISNVTGNWITAEQATKPEYWAEHIRSTVRFTEGIRTLLQLPDCIMLEVGPGRTLCSFTKQHQNISRNHLILPSLRDPAEKDSDERFLLKALGKLWLEGIEINWPAFYTHEHRRRIPLPTYPFERKRHWIEPVTTKSQFILQTEDMQDHMLSSTSEIVQNYSQVGKEIYMQEQPTSLPPLLEEQEHQVASTLANILGNLLGIAASDVDVHATFLELGAESLLILQFSRSIQDAFGLTIPFRLLLEEYSTISDLTKYIIQSLTLEGHLPGSERTQQQNAARETSIIQRNQPISTRPQRQISHTWIEQIITQQLQIMSQQLEVLQNKVTGAQKTPMQGTYEAQSISEARHHSAPDVRATSLGEAISSPNSKEIFVPHQSNNIKASKSLTLSQQQHIKALAESLNQRTHKSKNYTQTYRPFLADSKASVAFTLILKEMVYPIIFQRGANATIWDLDGNEYIDLGMGAGSLLFGHSPSFVLQALEDQVNLGLRPVLQSDIVGKVAELLCQLTGMERAFFCNSGTEAVMTALRLARTVTERTKIVTFEGSYHGTFDGVLASRQETYNGEISMAPLAPGIPPQMIKDTIVLRYGQPESLKYLKAHAHELAAILVEPVQSRRPDFLPVEFLRELRQLTEEAGAALIFDEVVTGFRSHVGGVQAMLGIQADLTIYGKALGSGMPIGAIAGRAVFMDAVDGGGWHYGDGSFPQAPQTFVMGTYFKHSFVMGVVWAVLNHLREEGSKIQQQLNHRTSQLVETLNGYFTQEGLPIKVVHFSSLFRFSFSRETNLIDTLVFFYHLLEKGIYVGEVRNCFLSTVHTEQEIASIAQAVKESVAEMRTGGFFT
jgi:acyl transferase domain-containing protein